MPDDWRRRPRKPASEKHVYPEIVKLNKAERDLYRMLARKRGIPRAVFFRRMLEVFGRADGIGEECRRRDEERKRSADRYLATPEGQELTKEHDRLVTLALVDKVLAKINEQANLPTEADRIAEKVKRCLNRREDGQSG